LGRHGEARVREEVEQHEGAIFYTYVTEKLLENRWSMVGRVLYGRVR
jgi:hypothetical protein